MHNQRIDRGIEKFMTKAVGYFTHPQISAIVKCFQSMKNPACKKCGCELSPDMIEMRLKICYGCLVKDRKKEA